MPPKLCGYQSPSSHAFRPVLLKLGGPQQPLGSLWNGHVQSTPRTMKSDFLGWTRRQDRFHPDCSEQLRANPPPWGPVGSLCEMSREGTHSNQGFHEFHTYSLTSFSQPVRFTHSELDLESAHPGCRAPLAQGTTESFPWLLSVPAGSGLGNITLGCHQPLSARGTSQVAGWPQRI